MAAADYKILIEAVDKTKRPLSNIEKQLDKLEARSSRVSSAFKGLGVALAGVGAGAAIKSVVDITARYEDLQDTLNTVSGSARDGAKAFDFVKKFATKTQFGVEDLTKAYIKLKGSGIEPTEKLLTTFTDTAAITTDQIGSLEAITDLFSRTTSGGLGLEELNRLADRGVPVFKILEEQLGLTRLEVSKFGKTAEGANEIREALVNGLNTSFGGATADRLDNLSTSMSNFKIALQNSAATLGGEFKSSIAGVINNITDLINNNQALIQSIGQGISTAVGVAVSAIQLLAENWEVVKAVLIGITAINIGPVLASAAGSVATLATRFASLGASATGLAPLLANPFTAIPAIIAGVVAGGLYYYKDELINVGNTSATVGETLSAVWNLVSENARVAASNVGQWFSEAWQRVSGGEGVVGAIQNIYNYISETTRTVATNIGQFFGQAWQSVVDGAGKIWSYIEPVYTAISGGVRTIANVYLNVWGGIAEFIGGVFTNIKSNWGSVVEYLGAKLKAFQASFMGIITKIQTAWAKMIQFIGTKFRDLVVGVANQVNQFSDITGFSIDTIGIETWASTLDAAVVRGENKMKEFANTAQAENARAAAAMQNVSIIPDVNIDLTRDRVGEIGTFVAEGLTGAGQQITDFVVSGGTKIADFMGTAAQKTQDFVLSTGETLTSAVEQQIIVDRAAEEQRRKTALASAESAATVAKETTTLNANTAAQQANTSVATAATTAANTRTAASQRIIDKLKEEKAELANLEAALKNVSALAREAGISEEALTKELQRQITALKGVDKAASSATRSTSKLGKQAKTTAKEFKSLQQITEETLQGRGTSLSSALTQDLLNARNPLDSFKDYFMGTIDDITSKVVGQNIVDPFVNNLNAMLTGQMDSIQGVAGGMGGGFGLNLGQGIGQMLGGFMQNIQGGISNMFSGMFGSGGLSGMFGGGGGLGSMFSNAWGGIQNFGSSLFGGVSSLFSGIGSSLGGLFGGFFADGGYLPSGKFGIAGESGPELIKGPAQVFNRDQVNSMMNSNEGASEPVAVNFYLNSIDTQTGTQFLLDNRTKIIGMVNEAYRRQGKEGVY